MDCGLSKCFWKRKLILNAITPTSDFPLYLMLKKVTQYKLYSIWTLLWTVDSANVSGNGK